MLNNLKRLRSIANCLETWIFLRRLFNDIGLKINVFVPFKKNSTLSQYLLLYSYEIQCISCTFLLFDWFSSSQLSFFRLFYLHFFLYLAVSRHFSIVTCLFLCLILFWKKRINDCPNVRRVSHSRNHVSVLVVKSYVGACDISEIISVLPLSIREKFDQGLLEIKTALDWYEKYFKFQISYKHKFLSAKFVAFIYTCTQRFRTIHKFEVLHIFISWFFWSDFLVKI